MIMEAFLSPRALLSLPVAVAFAIVHLFGARLSFLKVRPRSVWLSFAGGVSVAYVLVHVMPELANRQAAFERAPPGSGMLAVIEDHVWVLALGGLIGFYGLERYVRTSLQQKERDGKPEQTSERAFWLHLVSFAAYNLLIGYVLVDRDGSDVWGLVLYAVALGLHFIINDFALRESHGVFYDTRGRWVLAIAPLVGWTIGVATSIDERAIAALFAVLAGGVILNVLKEELPEERESRFWAFFVGAALYASLLLVVR